MKKNIAINAENTDLKNMLIVVIYMWIPWKQEKNSISFIFLNYRIFAVDMLSMDQFDIYVNFDNDLTFDITSIL